jgi:hypothetical protein
MKVHSEAGGGAYLPAKVTDRVFAVFRKVIWLLVVVLLLSFIFSMALGFYAVFFVPQSVKAASERVFSLPLSVFMVANFEVPLGSLGTSLGGLLLVLWFLYAGAFTLAWFDKPSFASSAMDGRIDIVHSNYLAMMPQIACVVLVLVILLQGLQESVGIPTGGLPPEAPVVQFVSLSYAPLIEEFSYRITTIGFIGGIFLLFKAGSPELGMRRPSRVRILLLSMWKPQAAKQLLGLRTIQSQGVIKGLLRSEWLLLVISSVAFGAAHYLSGGGWDIGKVSTAALAGFAMGFVYLRYGAYAPILLHWFFDFYFGAFDLASQLNVAGLGPLSDGINILNIGAGALFTLALVVLTLKRTWTAWGPNSRKRRVQASSVGEFPTTESGDLRSSTNAALAAAVWPKCRTCGVPMTPADEQKQYWYCHRDSLWFLAKQNAWVAEKERNAKKLQTTASGLEAKTTRTIERAFCYNCGEAVPSEATFCPACGTNQKHV